MKVGDKVRLTEAGVNCVMYNLRPDEEFDASLNGEVVGGRPGLIDVKFPFRHRSRIGKPDEWLMAPGEIELVEEAKS